MIGTHRKAAARSAFTLVEILVASAVLAIVLAIMLGALSTSLSLWRNTDNKIIADREARAVEFLLARDLANVVIPASTNLWPSVSNNATSSYLRFLTAVPAEAQPLEVSNAFADVCFVEYAVLPSANGPGREVRRLFWPSTRTYSLLLSNSFPGQQSAESYQSLGLNLVSTNQMAARGLGPLVTEANNTNFLLIGADMLAFKGKPSPSNYPVAVEVNFAVADPATLGNSNVIAQTNYVLRNAGLYTFRVRLPKPPTAP